MHSRKRGNLPLVPAAVVISLLVCLPVFLRAQMSEITEDGLSQISAQAGISPAAGNPQHGASSHLSMKFDARIEPAADVPGITAAANGDGGTLLFGYDTLKASLALTGIHVAESASGAPEDPSSWTFKGERSMDALLIETPLTTGNGTWKGPDGAGERLSASIPGTVRVQDVELGEKSFGPIAIDGITVHRLSITMPGPAR